MPPRSESAKSLATSMGARLRERRLELGLSLSEVARRGSVSPSYLTAVENGGSTASLAVLSRIAHAVDLTIGEFLATETQSAVELSHLGSELGTVTASSPALQLQVAFQNAEPGESGTCPFELARDSVVIYVREGNVEISVDGEDWQLDVGDSLHAQNPERVEWRTGQSPVTMVWAVAPAELA